MNKRLNSLSFLLIALHLVLGIGALGGGAAFVIDPSGEGMGMHRSQLEHSIFPDYLVPGIILICALGIIPLIIAWSLFRKWDWKLADRLNLFPDKHWAWTFSLYAGFELIIWIAIQVYILNMFSIIHLIYMTLGLAIQAVTLLPRVQSQYSIDPKEERG